MHAGKLGGAGIYIYGGKIVIVNSSFQDNTAMGPGGAISTHYGRGLKIIPAATLAKISQPASILVEELFTLMMMME